MWVALGSASTATAQVDFGPVYVSTETSLEVSITGEGPFTAGEPTIIGPDVGAFHVWGDACGSQPHSDGECFVDVKFAPSRTGAHTATLVLPVEGEPEPISIPLVGEGVALTRITPAELDFGTVPFESPPPAREVIVENTSDRMLGPLRASLPALFPRPWFEKVADSCSGATLAPGETCQMSIRFTAARRGSAESRVFLTSDPDSRIVSEMVLRGATPPAPVRSPLARPLLPRPAPPPSPDFSAELDERLAAALTRIRRVGRRTLLRHGLVVRGVVPPVRGVLGLVVRARGRNGGAGRLVAVRRQLPIQAGRKAFIRARLTRAGRRMLLSGRALRLRVELTLLARPDGRVSRAFGFVRVPRRR